MSDQLSAAEQYAILLNDNDAKFYAQVPSVIFHCTYLETHKDGTVERKKLSANAIAFYTLIKSIAGTESACWVNRDELAEMLGRSAGTITSVKKELQMPMEQLNGKPLLEITAKKKRHQNSSGGTEYHLCVPTHIWPENNAYMKLRKSMDPLPLGIVHNSEAPSNIDGVKTAPSNIDSVAPGALSNIDTNNRITEEEDPVKTEEPAASAASGCSSDDTFSVNSVKDEYRKHKEHAETQLRKFGCDENFIREMIRRFSPRQIIDGGVYTSKQLKRKKIGNRFGYLRNAIEKGRKWQDCKI